LVAPLLLAGTLLLLSTLFLGWYTINLNSGTSVYHETFYSTVVRLSGSQAGSSYSNATSYVSVFLGDTGILYLTVSGLVVAGVVVGLLAVYLVWKGTTQRHRKLVPTLVALVVAFALAGPMLVGVVQPATLCQGGGPPQSTPLAASSPSLMAGPSSSCSWVVASPSQGGTLYDSGNGPGPQTSFYGSSSVGGQPLTWGPSIGWFVAVVASTLLIAGAALDLQQLGSSTRPQLVRARFAAQTGLASAGLLVLTGLLLFWFDSPAWPSYQTIPCGLMSCHLYPYSEMLSGSQAFVFVCLVVALVAVAALPRFWAFGIGTGALALVALWLLAGSFGAADTPGGAYAWGLGSVFVGGALAIAASMVIRQTYRPKRGETRMGASPQSS